MSNGSNTTGLNLTETLVINAAYEHFWNPQWRTSVYGGWATVDYNDQANAMLCSNLSTTNVALGNGGTGTTARARTGCDTNWSVWWVGTRTQWNVTKDFYMGLDVIYQKLNTMSMPNGTSPVHNGYHHERRLLELRSGQHRLPLPRSQGLLSLIA